jgi:hypothetical protein
MGWPTTSFAMSFASLAALAVQLTVAAPWPHIFVEHFELKDLRPWEVPACNL